MNIKHIRQAEFIIRRQHPELPDGPEFDREVQLLLNDWLRGENDDFIEDTPCIEAGVHNCDDWGTGEGAYHGRI